MFSQCSHHFFFLDYYKDTCFGLAGGSNSSTYESVGEWNIGLVRVHVPASHVKTIPVMGIHTGCCRDQDKALVNGGGMDGWVDRSHITRRDKVQV